MIRIEDPVIVYLLLVPPCYEVGIWGPLHPGSHGNRSKFCKMVVLRLCRQERQTHTHNKHQFPVKVEHFPFQGSKGTM